MDVDGIVHILPFTCMPEIVAQSILPLVSRDYQLPILTMVVDEHTGIAGVRTRLEVPLWIYWPAAGQRRTPIPAAENPWLRRQLTAANRG